MSKKCSKKCSPSQICNNLTGRCVLKNGKVGKKIIKKSSPSQLTKCMSKTVAQIRDILKQQNQSGFYKLRKEELCKQYMNIISSPKHKTDLLHLFMDYDEFTNKGLNAIIGGYLDDMKLTDFIDDKEALAQLLSMKEFSKKQLDGALVKASKYKRKNADVIELLKKHGAFAETRKKVARTPLLGF
jgi:hypothetical protein